MREIALPVLVCALVWSLISSNQAVADDNDACQMFLCMAGKVQGNHEADGCEGSIPEYFSYQVWDPDFDPEATASLRDGVIAQCGGIASDPSGRNVQLRQTISNIYGQSPYDF